MRSSRLNKRALSALSVFTLALFFFTAPALALSQAEKVAAGDACVDAFNACDAKCDKKWDRLDFVRVLRQIYMVPSWSAAPHVIRG